MSMPTNQGLASNSPEQESSQSCKMVYIIQIMLPGYCWVFCHSLLWNYGLTLKGLDFIIDNKSKACPDSIWKHI